MRSGAVALAIAVAVAVGLGGGYLWGSRSQTAGPDPSATATPPAGSAAKAARKVLYYRNPMGLPDTSPVPKKDPMGMDYVAVYDGDEPDAGGNQIRISTDKVQKLGVRSEPVTMRALDKVVKAVGRIEVDERRVFAIAPKFEGWVEQLFVNATGQPVSKGQPLFEVYSPELVSAQREYAIASEAVNSLKDAGADPQASMKRLADSSLARLKNWDISEEQVRALTQSGETRRTLTFRSPVSGIVMEKKAVQGMRFMPGDSLYQVADLSSVWVMADVYEQDIASVTIGSKAKVSITAYPDRIFEGRITYVYPTLKPETRTVPVRLEIVNPGLLLKPAMFAQVELPVAGKGKVLTVPISAVIDSGTRRIVLVQLAEGRFEPREVKLGSRTDSYVEVMDGVKEGEPVVVAANFLIDAESNLKAAVGGFGVSAQGGTPDAAVGAATASTVAAAGTASATAAGTIAMALGTKAAVVGHRAEGTIQALDAKSGTLSIAHGPVESLKWPGMTMDFKAANDALLAGLKPGAAIAFEFVERSPGEWVITKVVRGGTTGTETKPAAQQGH
ncbi:MAG: efflux RND transporter periplasmic adaptor subunit [Betaproteobacteria bacterium]